MASGDEILQYIRDVTTKFDLARWIMFDTSLEEAVWDERGGKWKLSGKLNSALLPVFY
jgi:cation diffusion facilitator CzcD-associated flavoprotein CzcO